MQGSGQRRIEKRPRHCGTRRRRQAHRGGSRPQVAAKWLETWYSRPLPQKEDPDAPGLFAFGGCYLLKFKPAGTPCYYWGRLDREWDLGVKRYERRLVVNFADAAGDLSLDGGNWTTAKDYLELHEVTRAIAGHIIERYGDKCLSFDWSIFNEPDLGRNFWRTSWTDLQTFYDYSTDGVLRLRGSRLRFSSCFHRRFGIGWYFRHQLEAPGVSRPLFAAGSEQFRRTIEKCGLRRSALGRKASQRVEASAPRTAAAAHRAISCPFMPTTVRN